MGNQLTRVVIVLDRSGSMGSRVEEAVNHYNEQVQQLKEYDKDKDHDVLVSLITFNGQVWTQLDSVPASELKEASHKDYQPTGSTAMYDAMGYAVQRLRECDDNAYKSVAYLLALISDGRENASSHFDAEDVRKMISACEEDDKWTISYMGCDPQYVKHVGETLGIAPSNTANWSTRTKARAAGGLRCAAASIGTYMADRTLCRSKSFKKDTLYSDEVGTMADFDTDDADGTALGSETLDDINADTVKTTTTADASPDVVKPTATAPRCDGSGRGRGRRQGVRRMGGQKIGGQCYSGGGGIDLQALRQNMGDWNEDEAPESEAWGKASSVDWKKYGTKTAD